MTNQAPKSLAEIEAERQRQRWNYFWTPFITMTSVVSSIAMLMFLIKTCDERGLPGLLVPASSPLHDKGAMPQPHLQSSQRAQEREETSPDPRPQATESQSGRTAPSQ